MQAGQDRDDNDGTGSLDRPTWGRVFSQRQVRADLIVVRRIPGLPQVRSIQAPAAHGANQTLHTTQTRCQVRLHTCEHLGSARR